MSDHSEAIRNAIIVKENFVKEKIVGVLKKGQEAGEIKNTLPAESLINFIEDAWKGAMVTTKEYRSEKPLRNFLDVLEKIIL